MTYWILPASGIPISCDSVQRVTTAELGTAEMKESTAAFNERVSRRLEAIAGNVVIDPDVPLYRIFGLDVEDEDFIAEFNRVIDDPELPHADRDEGDDLIEVDPDNYVDMIVARRREPEEPLEQARVKRRALDPEGKPLGKAHETGNPLLDLSLIHI